MRVWEDVEEKQVGCQTREDEEREEGGKKQMDCQRISRQNEEGGGRISTNRMKNEQTGERTNSPEKGG